MVLATGPVLHVDGAFAVWPRLVPLPLLPRLVMEKETADEEDLFLSQIKKKIYKLIKKNS